MMLVFGRLFVCVATLAVLNACGESSIVPPTAPSLLPTEKVGKLTIACPANLTVQSQDGQEVQSTFPLPLIEGGNAPVVVNCSPESGSTFPIGTTEVQCTTSDAIGQTDTCTFLNIVLPPPILAVSSFMAFGDSLTAGVTSLPIQTVSQLELLNSYPTKLKMRLSQANPLQNFTMVNAGMPSELAADGKSRFQQELTAVVPEVAIILEGTNDLNSPLSNANLASSSVESMVMMAKAAGVDPILATIPPIRAVGDKVTASAQVVVYNNMIRAISADHVVLLVDVNNAIENGVCPTRPFARFSLLPGIRGIDASLSCIGEDHLHPTVEGYKLIADAFFDAIMATYGIPVTTAT